MLLALIFIGSIAGYITVGIIIAALALILTDGLEEWEAGMLAIAWPLVVPFLMIMVLIVFVTAILEAWID